MNHTYDSHKQIMQIQISSVDVQIVDSLISFVRTVKQTDAKAVVLNFIETEESYSEIESVKKRIEWAKKGQFLTDLIESSPILFIGVISSPCFGERFELFSSCHRLISVQGIPFGLTTDGKSYASRWGFLHRWVSKIKGSDTELRSLLLSKSSVAANRYFNATEGKFVSTCEEACREVDSLVQQLDIAHPTSYRLLQHYLAKAPFEVNKLHCLETTLYANEVGTKYYNRIQFLNSDRIANQLMTSEVGLHMDDFGNDYLKFDHTPEHELQGLKKKSRLEEVKKLINDPKIAISGRTIELGSGYGYFSSLLSKLPNVTEAVAVDISSAEMFRYGPYMWELLQPDWNKLRFVIGDMNKLESEYGTYDVVVFCASLHHSSDIPKSLEIANKLLKPNGRVILHGEHYDPILLNPKVRKGTDPHTITDYSKLLKSAGFRPNVFRYAIGGNRFPKLKRWVLETSPLKYINGFARFASYIMWGVKPTTNSVS